MEPSLHSGDRVLVRRIKAGQVRRGQIVVLEEPHPVEAWSGLGPPSRKVAGRRWLVKRVVACAGEPLPSELGGEPGASVPGGSVVVIGDNRELSVDSRHYGPVPGDRLLGRVSGRLPLRAAPYRPGRQTALCVRDG
jgi:signal peptidase I